MRGGFERKGDENSGTCVKEFSPLIMQKNIFIIGASDLQLPAILAAREMGLKVAVADYNPRAVGIPYADVYYNVSTIDEIGICEAARAFEADGIVAVATDQPMRAVAYAASQLHLPGVSCEVAKNATDKDRQIKIFQKAGLSIPWFVTVESEKALEDLKEQITFPCVCKPVDSSGSRGVSIVRKRADLLDVYQRATEYSSSGKVIFEEYLMGSEVSVELIATQGQYHVLAITDKATTGEPHFVETGHSQPSELSGEIQKAIKTLAIEAARSLGIMESAAHVEIMVTEKGPCLIEVGARLGGDCITSHLVPLSTGIDMVKATLKVALGMKTDLQRQSHKGSAICFLQSDRGRIEQITGMERARALPGVEVVRIHKTKGDIYDGLASSTDRIGYIIASADTAEKARAICNQAAEMIHIEVS